MNIYPDLDYKVWGEAINNALKDRTKENKELEAERWKFYKELENLMGMYIYFLNNLAKDNADIYEILELVSLEDVGEQVPFRDGVQALKAKRLQQSIRDGIIFQNYDDQYELALEFFSNCLEYFVHPGKYQEIQIALDIVRKNIQSPDQTFSIHHLREVEPLHFTALTVEEYEIYLKILTALSEYSGRIGEMRLKSKVHDIRERLVGYYADETEFEKNEEERLMVSDPLLYLRKGLYNQSAELLGYSYSILVDHDDLCLSKRYLDSSLSREEEQVDRMIKVIIREFYSSLEGIFDDVSVVRRGINRNELDKLLKLVYADFNRWLGDIDVVELQNLLARTSSVDKYFTHRGLCWTDSRPLNLRIQELKETILDLLSH